ncbi:competence protein CoiA [Enterococcus sp. BWR-S5]|uniref:competence protein CoiA n=1 Tax=Enterococcus sp. BWR-S5 TaxID=2787714 RepID=UPI001921AD4E|nr:competence protein CoiA family protein [Enterococcus sp. BWR-S5]MBL1226456.1 hypothetical protein [Enterococcus sp. BWR-S5]
MLVAKNDEGKLISLVWVSEKAIGKWKNRQFFCPICEQRVQLKKGQIRLPYFAHLSSQSCNITSGGESPEHLELKKIFAEQCRQQKIEHQLEAYLPEIKQRADLLIGRYAIEFQCSMLSAEEMVKRTRSYIENGYQPIWICGRKIWNYGKSNGTIRKFCSYSQKLGFYLWTADLKRKKLYLRYHVELKATGRLCYGTKYWNFNDIRFADLFEMAAEKRLFHYREYLLEGELSAVYQELYKKLRGKKRELLPIQSFYYQKGLNLLSLHPWFYYSINQSFVLGKSIFLFKYYFWEWLAVKGTVSKTEILHFCSTYIFKEQLHQLVPAVAPAALINWLSHYLIEGLLICQVLKRRVKAGEFEVIIDYKNRVRPHPTLILDEKQLPQVIITGTPLKI